MRPKDANRLHIGVLGCGPIAQAAHFDACTKARNADLYAICDVADDVRRRMQSTHAPSASYADYQSMLDDPLLDAVIIATSDAFHVDAARLALQAGKHVLCEKPLGVSVEEVEELKALAQLSGRVLQVGHMKRFDAGIQSARAFVANEIGALLAYKGWYCDSTHRYTVTDAVQPLIIRSANARKPTVNAKADLRRYHMLAHGSHLVDTARFLAGPIDAVEAKLTERFGACCWFITVHFANGTVGHLDLTVAVRMDWHEGFQIYGEKGSVLGKTHNPWLFKSSDVDIFREADGTWHRTLGADGHFYRRQLESFASVILDGATMTGANADDGVASVRAMVAIARSVESGRTIRLAEVTGPV